MTKKIPEELIEQIRSQSDIVDVISDYMQLTKRGRNWFGLCPFHGEQTPSFSVSQDKQIFHCFGCGAGGNAITFVMDIENIPFPDAVVKLGERAGVQLDVELTASSQPVKAISKAEANMRQAHDVAMEFYHHLLMNTEDGEEALQYLLNRGFTQELIESQKIGWALPSWDSLTAFLGRKEFSMEEMAECGLVIQRESDGSYFDRFRGRIMFPIRDDNGKVIAFSGRILNTDAEEAKYMNSPETPIFHKSEVLYNLDRARATIRKTRQVVLMEGFVDVLAATNAGVTNAVATMGTSLTPQHIQRLKRLVEQITVCYDGDSAGMEGARRSAHLLKAERLKVEVAVLPDKLDPDDYIRQYGAEAFKTQIIEKPQAYLAFMMMYARRNKNFQFENDVLQYVQEVLEELIGVSSPIERDLYITQLANETSISQEAIYAQYRKLEATKSKHYKSEQLQVQEVAPLPTTQKPLTAAERAERLLLSHMLHNVHVVDKVLQSGEEPFVRDEYMAVFVRLIGFYEEYSTADYQRFVEVIEDSELRKIVMEAALAERDPEHAEAEIADCLKHLKKHRIQLEIDALRQQQTEAEKMHEYKQAMEIVQKIIHLRRTLATM
ncbi:DNA primase [Metasolibacillus sp.]|uniref:DNA primase n=1 Tax=Metasolibacillus sp. TaxID=2703680 RepID=UPI0025FF206E|nr:DNA primase [Metasolibacillus sp.]MCT6922564.1 DNA primase [Metasolibacillus sp.]MCT6939097.1 DNA primase [Metasolibacillus sp.]